MLAWLAVTILIVVDGSTYVNINIVYRNGMDFTNMWWVYILLGQTPQIQITWSKIGSLLKIYCLIIDTQSTDQEFVINGECKVNT